MSLGVLEAPGRYGCALAIGEGQPAGNYLSYGGPHYGFLAARQEYARRADAICVSYNRFAKSVGVPSNVKQLVKSVDRSLPVFDKTVAQLRAVSVAAR